MMADNNENVLLELNSNINLDLLSSLNRYFTTEDNINPYEITTINSKFHDPDSFALSYSNTTSPIFLNINIQSLPSKYENLKHTILSLANNNISVPVIAVQEIWQIPYPDSINIPGYKFIYKQRKVNRGGGVGFYISQDIPTKNLPDLSPFIEKCFETLTIEITLNGKKHILSNIYRSPSPLNNTTPLEQLSDFIDRIDNLSSELSNLNSPTFIFSDSNLNLHNLPVNHSTEQYFISLHSNGFIQTVLKSTRIIGDSHSLIDHISTNIDFDSLNTGVIISDLSDHFIHFIQLPAPSQNKRKPTPKQSRSFSLENLQRFKLALSQLSWNDVVSCTDINNRFDLFWNDFNDLFSINFPITRVKPNQNIHKLNAFMTAGLLISRRTKHSLYLKSVASPTDANISKYKAYRNIYNSLVRRSRKLHYATSLFNCRKNP
jgi:hypothetical protein